MKPVYSLIVAMDNQGGIGLNNNLPWTLPIDLKHFVNITTNKSNNVVIMGRKSWDSIPEPFRPLKNRHNIVLSRQLTFLPNKNPYFLDNFETALEKADTLKGNEGEIFIIGGSSIYELAIKCGRIKNLYLTSIDKDFKCDRFFKWDQRFVFERSLGDGQDNEVRFCFELYGFNKSLLNYTEARGFVKSFKLKTRKDWQRFVKNQYVKPRPDIFPLPSDPQEYYRGAGWKSWSDFFSQNRK